MPSNNGAVVSARLSASRNLLTRKALAHAAAVPDGKALEDSFPPADVPPAPVVADATASGTPAAPPQPAPAPVWSEEDESAYQALAARRAAAGYRRRGRHLNGLLLRVGDVMPSPGTVVATIVAIVAERAPIARGALLDAMRGAAFAHPKAKPSDRAWCSGWLSGAVRGGFLAVADGAAVSR